MGQLRSGGDAGKQRLNAKLPQRQRALIIVEQIHLARPAEANAVDPPRAGRIADIPGGACLLQFLELVQRGVTCAHASSPSRLRGPTGGDTTPRAPVSYARRKILLPRGA